MNSPFKFLDAYSKEDKDIFFGRDQEIELLYEKTFETNLVLLYGASGTGKTSLINCGLSNKFADTDWFALFVRRRDNIINSLQQAIRQHAVTPIPEDAPVRRALKSLFYDQYKPIYLIFDQFEEIFILGDEEEQQAFFQILSELLKIRIQCTILLSMREEYLAYISDYEKVIPSLFDNRLRVERMNYARLEEVISGTAKAFDIEVVKPEETIKLMINNLRDKRGVDLTNLQVYMDRLYRKEMELTQDDKVFFTPDLVNDVGELSDVLGLFLEEQMDQVEGELGKKGVAIDVLFALVTDDGTKRAANEEAIAQTLFRRKNIDPKDVAYCIKRFKEMRIFKEID